MKQTQIYLDEGLWRLLQIRSRLSGTSIPELVRQAVREKYGIPAERRRQAMQAVVGMWKDRTGLPDTETYIRQIRKGARRLRRLQ